MEIVGCSTARKTIKLMLFSYAVYIAILIFYLGFAYFMYPETRHRSVEEVSMVFDKDRSNLEALHNAAINEIQKDTVEVLEHCGERHVGKS